MPRKPRLTVVGSINVDLVARVERLPRPGETVTDATLDYISGGKGANQAVAARKLGALVRMNGCVGSDRLSDLAVRRLGGAGVDTSPIFHVGGDTGIAIILVAESGDNQIVVVPGANALLTPDDVDLGEHDGVLCQLEIPIETVAAAASESTGFFCLNAAPARDVPADVVERADLVVANRYEYDALGVQPRLAAVTLGEEGAVLFEAGREIARAVPPKVKAVDGTAAGDAFTACIAVSLLEGRDRDEALRRGCAAGAIAASRFGAQPSLPTADEVDAILRS
ncbi:MAG: ribokinase [Gaiellaceae bacterium]